MLNYELTACACPLPPRCCREGVAFEEIGQLSLARADYERVVELDTLDELTTKARERLATLPR
jgi:hypothetical protein